ncbi:hypothetical protein [uncultured Gilvimarinus sp.]|uniref:hypothetical protein n=1 Tax=uncultured Gilvimarinus sp. TaxID=1689143 RepID=UPI0030DB8901
MSRLAYNNIFLDPTYSTVVFTDEGATFTAAQPLSNLAKMQLPDYAQFTGETAELDADAGAEYAVDVLALLGHTLTDGMQVEFLDGATSLGTVTVANYRGLAQNVILLLDTPVTLQTLTVSITGGTSEAAYKIGAVWASESYKKCFAKADYGRNTASLSNVAWASATAYVDARESQGAQNFRFTPLARADAIGPAYPNAEAVLREINESRVVLAIPYNADPAQSIYGIVESTAGPKVDAVSDRWRASVSVTEQR